MPYPPSQSLSCFLHVLAEKVPLISVVDSVFRCNEYWVTLVNILWAQEYCSSGPFRCLFRNNLLSQWYS